MKKNIFLFILITMLAFNCVAKAQNEKDTLNKAKLYFLGGTTAAAFVYGYAIQNTIWWKGSKTEFHFNFNQDWNYALGADKFGHFFFGTAITKIYSNAFMWSGMNRKKSLLYSGLLAFSYQTFIEIRDGFSEGYGFSWGDFAANTLGALYPNLQYKYPALKNFNFKLSFFPSERFKNGSNRYILDDYESTYNWLSINFRNFLPNRIRKYIPKFIAFSIGHSVKKLDTPLSNHEFFLALDWDFSYLKTDSAILRFLKTITGLYHLPSPAVKIYPNVIWYGLKF